MVRIRVTTRSGTRRVEQERRISYKVDSFYKTFKKSISLREFNLDKEGSINYIYFVILDIFYGITLGIAKNFLFFLATKLNLGDGAKFTFNFWCFLWAPFMIATFHILATIIFYIFQRQNLGKLLLLIALSFVHCIFLFFVDVFFVLLFIFFNIRLPISIGFMINTFLTGYIITKNYSSDLAMVEDRDIVIFTVIKLLAVVLINIPYYFNIRI